MCRHLGYLGVPTSPHHPLVRAPHALTVQAWAPADMRGGGTVNVDGFGLGWFADDGRPVRYRRPAPVWTDEDLPRLAETVRSDRWVAAVRSGTPGMPVTEAACAPFADDEWLFSHNGVVSGWPESVSAAAEKLPVAELLRLPAPTDSALLWALLRRRLHDGDDPVDAVLRLTWEVAQAAPGSRLNLLLVGRDLLIATAWGHALSVLRSPSGPDGVFVASEPWDADPGWEPVPDGGLVVARRAVSPDGGDTEVGAGHPAVRVDIDSLGGERSQA
ncbi:ergothioneine biosynthesis protein EgtC [Saccharomonospora iraqiensis]|uniref:ergothioneine biosynthesis protein EgtC n=1 Tax=Saccharomonospora iraqiensis TaxID=52698 RepID=UPI00022E11CA|nr:ergothioneine biosynthesis protein EgtC [Saccharomonospora iraqiensis]